MTLVRRTRWSLFAVAALVASLLGFGTQGLPAAAHGTTITPASRLYQCRFLEPTNPMCALAWQDNAQSLYDWMGLLISDAAGREKEIIPDGKLCSAGKPEYAAFDRATATWPVTNLVPGSNGLYHIEFLESAPHATLYFRWYLTRNGYDPTVPLRWSDLDLVYDSGRIAAVSHYHDEFALPARTGRQLMYMVWQRSDSPEAFYSCSDVTINAPVPPTSTTVAPTTTVAATTTVAPTTTVAATTTTAAGTTTTATPTTTVAGTTTTVAATTTTRAATTTTVARTTTTAKAGGGKLTLTTTSNWGSGHCAAGTVKNMGTTSLNWSVKLTIAGQFTSFWDGTYTRVGNTVTVKGAGWNNTILPGATAAFGYCASGAPGVGL
jgi:predicted carbohydrate-binding protein with CBM5 and CBM33 domain